MKKICLFSAQYLPTVGGVERYTYYVAKKLIEKGFKVTVVTSKINDYPSYEKSDEGIEIYRIPCFNLLNGRFPVLKLSPELSVIKKKLKDMDFDYVVINTRFYVHSLFGAKFARKNKIPSIVIEHGSSHLTVNNKLFDFVGGVFEHFITSRVKKNCDSYYGVSKECCNWLKHFNIDAKGTLYNACDSDLIQKIQNGQAPHYRADYNVSNDKQVITFVGRMVEEKGVMSLLNAFKKIDDDNSVLFIAGGGKLLEEAKKYASDKIIVLGALPYEEVITLLNESDVFCLPSVSEGFCTSILEAIYCDCLVCSTNVGGASEIIEDNKSGIIINSPNEEDVYNALLKVLKLNNKHEYKQKAKNSLIECGCTFEATTQKIIKIFEDEDRG